MTMQALLLKTPVEELRACFNPGEEPPVHYMGAILALSPISDAFSDGPCVIELLAAGFHSLVVLAGLDRAIEEAKRLRRSEALSEAAQLRRRRA